MYRYISFVFGAVLALALFTPLNVHAIQGDADGNGVVNLEDARTIARFVVGQISPIPNRHGADANQDGKITMEDAFIIAKRISNKTRIVVVAPRHGRSDMLKIGSIIRVEVFEKFFPFRIKGGTVRITSASRSYNSGPRPLTFERDGRSLYYHWDTAGLTPASDYRVKVILTDASGKVVTSEDPAAEASSTIQQADALISLESQTYEPHLFSATIDAYCPTPGLSLVFRRIVNNDFRYYPYLGPLGRGWVHNYDLRLEEHTDGRVEFHGPENMGRFFQSNADGTYSPEPGDYGVLTRDPSGAFQLKEKNGLTYRFRSDLRLDYMSDLNGNRISAVYDGSGNLAEIRHSCGKSLFLQYNSAGRIISLTDHAGRMTSYEYDVTNTKLVRVVDPAGNATQYDYSRGEYYIYINYLHQRIVCTENCEIHYSRLISVAYPDGTFEHYERDDKARLTLRTRTWGANPVTYSYDEEGRTHITDAVGAETVVAVNERGQTTSVVDPDSGKKEMEYDNDANLIKVTDPLGNATQMSYDEFGNMTSVTNPLGEAIEFGYDLRFNKPEWITNPLGKTVQLGYDAHGNLSTTVFSDGTKVSFSYDTTGNLTKSVDAAGKITTYSYNGQGQMVSLKDALGHLTTLSYKTSGELEKVDDAKGHEIAYEYDLLGRLLKRTYPDASHEDYEYDAGGKLTSFTNRKGQKILLSHDNTGRLETKEDTSGEKVHFHYDARGLNTSVERESGGTTALETYREYDLSRRLTVAKVPGKTDAETYDVSYAYDTAGNRKRLVYPDGYVLNYEYDAANRLTRISDGTGNAVVEYSYDTAGQRVKRTLGNGTYATYVYDDLGRLTKLRNYSPQDGVQSQFEYNYNAAGIRTTMKSLEGTHMYTYDDTYQLTAVQYPEGKNVQYTFDEVGNRISVNVNGQIANYTTNNLNQYTQVGSEILQHDSNGNLFNRTVGGTVTSYGWDKENRLVSVDRGGKHIEFRYDHRGRLVAKRIDGEETRYIWDGRNLIAEMNSSGALEKRYIYGANIDEIILVSAETTKDWTQQDGLGSVVGTTNDSGATVATASYDVYGNVREENLPLVPQRFAGMWWEEDVKLYYVRERWFDPSVGRFLSTDPLGVLSGLNLYSYVLNSPTNYTDPLGMEADLGDLFEFINWHLEYIGDCGNILRGKTRYWNSWQNEWEWGPSFGPNDPQYAWDGDGRLWKNPNYLPPLPPDSPARPENWPKPDRYIPPEDWHSWMMPHWGGQCPTFIQLPQNSKSLRHQPAVHNISREDLAGEIMAPIDDTVLRSDIPIFGIAGGKNFISYRVEYGKSMAPKEWHLIEESAEPKSTNKVGLAQMRLMQGDLDIRGNLATWNTGLKNWSHLPWHPPEDQTDLNGVYNLRLTVFGKNGEKAEDTIQVEVGRVIAQCLPGIAISPDKRVVMRFQEQSLTHPFRIYTILPLSEVGEDTPSLPKACEAIGPVYRIREPGDQFIKEVILDFEPLEGELGKLAPERLGICRFDVEKKQWIWLKTVHSDGGKKFSTTMTELPTPKAIYALMADPKEARSSRESIKSVSPTTPKPMAQGVLVDESFEKDLGTFKPRDRLVGAKLERDNKATPDGSSCLKLVNENHGGNFSATVLDHPFDVREYTTMSFDYRVGPGVKLDFYTKVNGRWYDLGFMDDPTDYRNRDVNIANLGAIDGIIADDQWHTASVDLRYLLGRQTRHTKVEEIILADWDVGGYMKLEFGQNPRGSTVYIDNFKLTGPGNAVKAPAVLTVDNFDAAANNNGLGGASGTYCNPGTRYMEMAFADVPPHLSKPVSDSKNRDRALKLSFDTTQAGAYAGYWTALGKRDLSDYSVLAFRVWSDNELPPVKVGIRSTQGIEGKTVVSPYAASEPNNGWRDVRIPLSALKGLPDFSSADVLFFSATNAEGSWRSNLWIDDVRLEQTSFSKVTDFETPLACTLSGGDYSTSENGAGAISAVTMTDPSSAPAAPNTVCRVSYGGSIGRDYGINGGFSFAGWHCGLNGIDATPFDHLALRVKGEKGGETPNFYLNDGNRRICLRAKETTPVTGDWQEILLPLAHYERNGLDMSHLTALEIVFEWTEQSGTIYVDDIQFKNSKVSKQ